MSQGHGRRKPPHTYSGTSRGETPRGSNYRPSPAGHRDEYYTQEYSYRSEGHSYGAGTSSYPVSNYSHAAPWSYEQQRLDYDSRSWRREEGGRRSPVYDDYPGYREDASDYPAPRDNEWQGDYGRQQRYSQPYSQLQAESHYRSYSGYGQGEYERYYRDYATSSDGYSDYRRLPETAYHDSRRGHDYDGYRDYRRPPPATMEHQQPESYSNYNSRPSSPPPSSSPSRGFATQARAPIKPVLFQSSPITRPPLPPKPPKRTEPRESYLAISSQPSPHIQNPSDARKLIVLDLNGSLVLRSAHSRRIPPPRGGGSFDPYADPTQLRPLRTVHRRPYLSSFTSYILHEETKKWLDTMVWSSAQPHSVADMVEHCFGNRKSELKAVWARDTLGLTADDYHKKSLTLKDLEKPWAELPLTQATQVKEEEKTSADTTKSAASHSALTTLLVDDSPAKAALQPWNHLCIRDYVQAMRNMDLLVADREHRTLSKALSAPKSNHKTANTIEGGTHPVQKITREVVMVNGELTNQKEEIVKRVTREVVMIEGKMVNAKEEEVVSVEATGFVPNAKRKAKRLAKKESARLEREEREREAFMSLRGQVVGTPPMAPTPPPRVEEQAFGEVAKEDGQEDGSEEPEMRYDETLLAVVGVLDHAKHEGNIAGWMRGGGLLHTARGQASEAPAPAPVPALAPPAPAPASASAAPPSVSTPALPEPSRTEPSTSRKHQAPSRSASPSQNESPTKKVKLSTPAPEEPQPSTSVLPTPPPPTAQTSESTTEEQASTGVPLSSPVPAKTAAHIAAPAGLWYEDPAVLRFWADRGREALKALDIKVESGIVAIPGVAPHMKP
ncbi:hypothetical protein BDN70DRAFT_864692 [Pholiota conissans]|uniref:FCP1 homology domain-containing protein n=1 Tax=Pholiota conissans TaxID=109636 RepID=A0A9P5YUW0_9AGAR|nr:hypothetical protein BDN70DRAFT_864692 [Pholiota conissans]